MQEILISRQRICHGYQYTRVAVSSAYREIEKYALKSSWAISHAKMELFQTLSMPPSAGCWCDYWRVCTSFVR